MKMRRERYLADAGLRAKGVEAAAAGPDAGWVEGYAAVWGDPDHVDADGEYFVRGAFARSIAQRVPAGKIKLMARHYRDGGDVLAVVGTVREAREDDRGLWFRAEFAPDPDSQAIRQKVVSGHVRSCSVGFRVLRTEQRADSAGQYRLGFVECILEEVTLTVRPANEDAVVTAAKSRGGKLSHTSRTADSEPPCVDKTKLPRIAFADRGEAGKPSTWRYPHHWVEGGGDPDYTTGTLWLHEGGLRAAWAAAMGARSGEEEKDEAVIEHLRAHREALGMEEEGVGGKDRREGARRHTGNVRRGHAGEEDQRGGGVPRAAVGRDGGCRRWGGEHVSRLAERLRTAVERMEALATEMDKAEGEGEAGKARLEALRKEYDGAKAEAESLRRKIEEAKERAKARKAAEDAAAAAEPDGKATIPADSPAEPRDHDAEERAKEEAFMDYFCGKAISDRARDLLRPSAQAGWKEAQSGVVVPKRFADAILPERREFGPYRGKALPMVSGANFGNKLFDREFQKTLLMYPGEDAFLFPRCFHVPTKFGTVLFPKLTQGAPGAEGGAEEFAEYGYVACAWTAEGAEKPGAEPKFEQVTLQTYELAARTEISRTLISRSAVDIEQLMGVLFRASILHKLDLAIIQGNGSGKPLGLLNDASGLTHVHLSLIHI
ncbi:MAG: phage major capsid protein, partial [Planctomycetota bacterium]|nr:phage major capsid protein [Planctomycetota bacterium]